MSDAPPPAGPAALRLSVSRGEADADGAYVYRGDVVYAGVSFGLTVRATSADAAISWDTAPQDSTRIEKVVKALVRAATRAELAAGAPPPRRITRWREVP